MDSASSGFESAMICTIDRDGASAAAAGFPPVDGVAVGLSKTYLTGPSEEATVGGAAVPEAGASATPSGLEGRDAPMSVSREGGCADAIVDAVLTALPIAGLGAGGTAVFCGVGAGVASVAIRPQWLAFRSRCAWSRYRSRRWSRCGSRRWSRYRSRRWRGFLGRFGHSGRYRSMRWSRCRSRRWSRCRSRRCSRWTWSRRWRGFLGRFGHSGRYRSMRWSRCRSMRWSRCRSRRWSRCRSRRWSRCQSRRWSRWPEHGDGVATGAVRWSRCRRGTGAGVAFWAVSATVAAIGACCREARCRSRRCSCCPERAPECSSLPEQAMQSLPEQAPESLPGQGCSQGAAPD